jgi:uncharacterized protein (DUF433 family)
MDPTNETYIESRPGKCGGRPCIRGTRIRVQDIYVWHEMQSMSADDIVSEFPELSLSQVYAALAYFWEHQAEIRAQMKEEHDFVEQLRSAAGPGLLERLAVGNRTSDPVSS